MKSIILGVTICLFFTGSLNAEPSLDSLLKSCEQKMLHLHHTAPQVMASDRTPFSRMLRRVMVSLSADTATPVSAPLAPTK
jgi:hypothetical protein